MDGYECNITDEQLKGAPHYSQHETWDWSNPDRSKTIHDYYNMRVMGL